MTPLSPLKTANPKVLKSLQQHQRRLNDLRQNSLPKVNTFIHDEIVKTKKELKNGSPKSKTIRNTILISIVSLVGFLSYDSIVGVILDYNFQLRPNGIAAGAWQVNPIPIHLCFYLFAITNGHAFLRGAKPHLHDKGPYCYNLFRMRTIVEWTDDAVKYTERYRFEFNEEMSQPMDEPITMINLPIFASVMAAKGIMETYYVGFLGPIVYNAMTTALRASGEQLIEQITARQLMESRKLPILEYIDMFIAPIRSIGVPLPNFKEGFMGIVDHSFGITTSGAAFEVGPYYAYRRSEKGHVVGHIFQYASETQYTMYRPPCNRMGGSDAIFHPRPLQTKHLYVYPAHQLCRVLRFDRNNSEYYAGAQVLRYNLDLNMYDARLKRNRCFCTKSSWQQCDGWHDMSPCLWGVPIGITNPHFYQSPSLLSKVTGLHPEKEKHLAYLLMEPQFGVPVFAKVTLQPVLGVTPIRSVAALSRLPTLKMPLMWVRITRGADGALAVGLFIGSNSVRYGSYGFLLGGLALLGFMFAKKAFKRNSKKSVE